MLAQWTSIYNYATILIPSLFTAPRYFRGEIEFGVISQVSGRHSRTRPVSAPGGSVPGGSVPDRIRPYPPSWDQLGPPSFPLIRPSNLLPQASFAFQSIESALSVIVNNLAQLSGLAAETDRLDALREAMLVTGAGGGGGTAEWRQRGNGAGEGGW